MTKEEKDFIEKNISFGFADKSEFPHLKEGDTIPWVAIPNMEKPDGSMREFGLDEIIQYLKEAKNDD